MAIVGLGTDIVEIARIESALSRTDAFAKRILSVEEWTDFETTKFPERYLAKRFAVKEAAAKALGTGISQGVSFEDFTVAHDALGKPILILSGKAQAIAAQMGVKNVCLTIADERHYAVATVIFES